MSPSDTVLPNNEEVQSVKGPNLGQHVAIWWPGGEAFRPGTVTQVDSATDRHCIQYDDGDTEFLDMNFTSWDFLGYGVRSADDHIQMKRKKDNEPISAISVVPQVETIPGQLPKSGEPSSCIGAADGARSGGKSMHASKTDITTGLSVITKRASVPIVRNPSARDDRAAESTMKKARVMPFQEDGAPEPLELGIGSPVAVPNRPPMGQLHVVPGTSAQHAVRNSTGNDNSAQLHGYIEQLKRDTGKVINDIDCLRLSVHNMAKVHVEIKDAIAQLVAITKNIARQIEEGDRIASKNAESPPVFPAQSPYGPGPNGESPTFPICFPPSQRHAPVRQNLASKSPVARTMNRGRPRLSPTKSTLTPRRRSISKAGNTYEPRRTKGCATPSQSPHSREVSPAVPPPQLEPLQQYQQRRVSVDRASSLVCPPQQRVAYENAILQIRSKILQLAARHMTVWLLVTDHKCRTSDISAWLFQESAKCMKCAAFAMGKFPNYKYALRSLPTGLNIDGASLEWFVAGPSPENLALARHNYDVRHAPPSDADWSMEEKLLAKLAECFHGKLNEYRIGTSNSVLSDCIAIASCAASFLEAIVIYRHWKSQHVNSGSLNHDVAEVSNDSPSGMSAHGGERRSITGSISASAQLPTLSTQHQSPNRKDGDATEVDVPEARTAAAQGGSMYRGL